MTFMRRVTVLAIAFAAVTAIDARAQETIVVRGLGVGTFGSFNTTRLLGVGLGVTVSEVLQVTGV
jgi:hypothetical protein